MSKYVDGTKFHILTPLELDDTEVYFSEIAKKVTDMGFVRFQIGNQVYSVADEAQAIDVNERVYVVIDRLIKKSDEAFLVRLRDSLRIALERGNDMVSLVTLDAAPVVKHFSLHAACPICGYHLEELSLSNFSFNSHRGACPTCHGIGSSITFREQDIINPELTLAEGAILPWQAHPYYMMLIEAVAKKENISINTSWSLLSEKDKKKILYGVPGKFEVQYVTRGSDDRMHYSRYEGIIPNLERRYNESGTGTGTDAFVKRISQFATEQPCRSCHGYRLSAPFLQVKILGKNIGELSELSVEGSLVFFQKLELSPSEKHIADPILKNVVERLEFLSGV